MPHTFVLVHGAWHGGWCWRRVADRLRSAGQAVFTPTLTGLGERSHLLRAGIDLKTHIADVVNLMKWERVTDIVLCGHSYGGMVISGVAEQMPSAIRSIVFLDAFVPRDGESTQYLSGRGTLKRNANASLNLPHATPPIYSRPFGSRRHFELHSDASCCASSRDDLLRRVKSRLARFDRFRMSAIRSLLGANRTSRQSQNEANDPKRTSGFTNITPRTF